MATAFNAPLATKERHQTSWGFWFLWVAASTVGFALGAAAFWALGEAYREESGFSAIRTLAFVLTGVIVTTSPGLLHWLILRQRFPQAGWWVLASSIGSVFGFVMLLWGFAVGDTRGGDKGFWPITYGYVVPILAIALGGAGAGTMQWFVLRRWMARSFWWVPISSISWVVATWTYMTLTRANDVHLFLGAALSGALSGAIMGLGLVWLLHNTKAEKPVAAVADGRRGRPFLLSAAWISPIIPLVVASLVEFGARSGPYKKGDNAVFIAAFVACCVGLLAGLIGLCGIKSNGVLATLPAAVLGLLLNATVGIIALLILVLSGLPQSP
jgi:hypothetical protein